MQFQLKRECGTQSLFVDSIINVLKQKQNPNMFSIIQDITSQYIQCQTSVSSYENLHTTRELFNSDVGNVPEIVLLLSKLRKLGKCTISTFPYIVLSFNLSF